MAYSEFKHIDYKIEFMHCFFYIKSCVNLEACKELESLFLVFPIIVKP